jgi:hypothetical protein
MRAALIFALASVLAACGERGADRPSGADASVAVKSGPLDVTERGVGPLGGATPFTAEAIRAAYPDAHVQQVVFSLGGVDEPALRADAPDGKALEVFGDEGGVSRVLVLGGAFTGPGGERLLQPWPETGFRIGQCRAGEGRWTGALVCRRPDDSRVQVMFAVPGWTGGDPPPEAVLRERAKVSALEWTDRVR